MNKSILKWSIGIILIVLIVLNPSTDQFREFVGNSPYYVSKKYNFLLFSIYDDTYNGKRYVGVIYNFIDAGEAEKKTRRMRSHVNRMNIN